jgi:hypothetical protein
MTSKNVSKEEDEGTESTAATNEVEQALELANTAVRLLSVSSLSVRAQVLAERMLVLSHRMLKDRMDD